MRIHLLCSNYWARPICLELLHATSRFNATKSGEQKRPSSGRAKVIAHQKPVKTQKRTDHSSRVTDWIGGICTADALLVWFPADWVPMVTQALQGAGRSLWKTVRPDWHLLSTHLAAVGRGNYSMVEIEEKLFKNR